MNWKAIKRIFRVVMDNAVEVITQGFLAYGFMSVGGQLAATMYHASSITLTPAAQRFYTYTFWAVLVIGLAVIYVVFYGVRLIIWLAKLAYRQTLSPDARPYTAEQRDAWLEVLKGKTESQVAAMLEAHSNVH